MCLFFYFDWFNRWTDKSLVVSRLEKNHQNTLSSSATTTRRIITIEDRSGQFVKQYNHIRNMWTENENQMNIDRVSWRADRWRRMLINILLFYWLSNDNAIITIEPLSKIFLFHSLSIQVSWCGWNQILYLQKENHQSSNENIFSFFFFHPVQDDRSTRIVWKFSATIVLSDLQTPVNLE